MKKCCFDSKRSIKLKKSALVWAEKHLKLSEYHKSQAQKLTGAIPSNKEKKNFGNMTNAKT